jgi:hypothetical protein
MIRTAILFILAFLMGMAHAQESNPVNTLQANDAISNELIERLVDESTAEILLQTPYEGFYKIRGKAIGSRITFGKEVADQSYPDDRWTHLAAGIAGLIELPAIWPGSHLKPRATAFVVFYDYNIPGLDRSKVELLPTSSNAPPNMLAVLVIEKGPQTNSTDLTHGSLLIFELAM